MDDKKHLKKKKQKALNKLGSLVQSPLSTSEKIDNQINYLSKKAKGTKKIYHNYIANLHKEINALKHRNQFVVIICQLDVSHNISLLTKNGQHYISKLANPNFLVFCRDRMDDHIYADGGSLQMIITEPNLYFFSAKQAYRLRQGFLLNSFNKSHVNPAIISRNSIEENHQKLIKEINQSHRISQQAKKEWEARNNMEFGSF